MKATNILFILIWILYSCNTNTNEHIDGINPISVDKENSKSGKPTDKDIILMVMKHSDVLLTVHSSCTGVGSEFSDSTIGDFISSFWQYHVDSTSRNYIDITIIEGDNSEIKEKHWKAIFMINGQTENDNWSWGVSFYIIDKNWTVVRESFMCLGAG